MRVLRRSVFEKRQQRVGAVVVLLQKIRISFAKERFGDGVTDANRDLFVTAERYAAWVSSSEESTKSPSVSASPLGGMRMWPSSLTSSNRTETGLDTPDSCMVTP